MTTKSCDVTEPTVHRQIAASLALIRRSADTLATADLALAWVRMHLLGGQSGYTPTPHGTSEHPESTGKKS